jgi:hypothetical protein
MPKKYTTEIVQEMLAQEGWELLNEYVSGKNYLLIKNPDRFNGYLCTTMFKDWVKGARPGFISLVDKTDYIKEVINAEGWEVEDNFTFQKAKEYFFIRNKKRYKGVWCKTTWDMWNSGVKPGERSVVDKTSYVNLIVGEEGWQLSRPINFLTDFLYLKHIVILKGHEVRFRFASWKKGARPDIRSLVKPEEYIKEHLKDLGYEIIEENFIYKGDKNRFTIKNLETGKESRINWAHINSGDLPNSPKVLIRSRINQYLKTGVAEKYFSSTLVLGEDYWKKLKEKFPRVPEGLEIDHVIPCSFWGFSESQVVLANSIENLRLLPKRENVIRGNRLKASELDEYDLWDLYYQAENPKGLPLIEDRYDIAS